MGVMSRRDLLFASGLSLLARRPAFAQGTTPPRAQPQTGPQARLLEALRANRLPLTMSDAPAGRGWEWLVQEARDARFTLIGEEHGVAETAQLSAALFNAVRGSGYSRIAIELSPIIAQDIEAAARRNGLQGILDFFARPDTWSPSICVKRPNSWRVSSMRSPRVSELYGDSTVRFSAIAI
jgi:hypothetical protein